MFPISPIFKWSCRKIRTNLQTWHKGRREGWEDTQPSASRVSIWLLICCSHHHSHVAQWIILTLETLQLVWLLKSDVQTFVTAKQADQKLHHDNHSRLCFLYPGEPVAVKDFRYQGKWIPGTIVQKLGPITYSVEVKNGQTIKRHVDHLMRPMQWNTCSSSAVASDFTPDNFFHPTVCNPQPNQEDQPLQEPMERCHYPQRDRHPPNRLMQVC